MHQTNSNESDSVDGEDDIDDDYLFTVLCFTFFFSVVGSTAEGERNVMPYIIK